jgi:hypothetical protein
MDFGICHTAGADFVWLIPRRADPRISTTTGKVV